MRICLGVVAVILCVFFGYKLSYKFTERKKFYSSFNVFNKRLIDEVSYTKKSILNVISEQGKDEEFYKFTSGFFIDKKIPELDNKKYSSDEINYYREYLEQIGCTDSITQIQFLKTTELYLSDKLSSAIENEKKYKSLYVKLGFLLGLLILVIII